MNHKSIDTIYDTIYNAITIPKHEPIKKVYVQMVKDVIESEEANHEDTELVSFTSVSNGINTGS